MTHSIVPGGPPPLLSTLYESAVRSLAESALDEALNIGAFHPRFQFEGTTPPSLCAAAEYPQG